MSWPNFELDEFECHHCHENLIDHRMVDRLQSVRTKLGFPLKVTSGYRCPVHNAAVSTTGPTGPHTTGHAVDIAVRGSQALQLVQAALAAGFTGVGIAQKGENRYVHLDDLPNAAGQPRPTVWSY